MQQIQRDLQRDLEICERATQGPWTIKFDDEIQTYAIETLGSDVLVAECEKSIDANFIVHARTGWPHAIRRAIAAEARVAELEAENARLREQLRDLNEYKHLAAWGLRKVFGEKVVRHGV